MLLFYHKHNLIAMILSAYEIVQTIIRRNLLIVSVVSTCIVALKKTIKKLAQVSSSELNLFI